MAEDSGSSFDPMTELTKLQASHIECMARTHEKLASLESQIQRLESQLEELTREMHHYTSILLGNGTAGIAGRLTLNEEKTRSLETRWKWVMGILGATIGSVTTFIVIHVLKN